MTRHGILNRGTIETLTLAREMAQQTAAREAEWQRHRRRQVADLARYLAERKASAAAAPASPGWREMLKEAAARLTQLASETDAALAHAEARLRATQKDLNVAENLAETFAKERKSAALRADAAAIAELCATRAAR
ncbi:MAG: hypothetical protein LGL72_05015 [Acidibrevibacterium sp.]|jgi:uncharacterized sporulation protein YeaH/YhbH (DUF444 family)|uniref:hypothetical protein n=1 Tax=Acidibrevibacterium fodinaquatile TaxID=1969806 RepID=UPI0023A8ACF3|nr:hypothetical protein [Acidibrevibacterium fodinaquatile]MCA7118764.1 hypothetical protein [Acidibrevibacterium fodinaquatile]